MGCFSNCDLSVHKFILVTAGVKYHCSFISDSRFLRPGITIEHAVVDGLAEVVVLDVVGAIDVGDGAGQTKDFVVGAGR